MRHRLRFHGVGITFMLRQHSYVAEFKRLLKSSNMTAIRPGFEAWSREYLNLFHLKMEQYIIARLYPVSTQNKKAIHLSSYAHTHSYIANFVYCELPILRKTSLFR